MIFKGVNKQSAKKISLEMYSNGWKVSVISKVVQKAESTIYSYLQEEYDNIRFPVLKQEIKKALLQEDFRAFVMNLPYKDICLIRRNYHLYGWDKDSKIEAILGYFKHYSVLGLYPDNLNQETIKKAFFRKAKKVHPDLNKEMHKSGKAFQEVHQSYEYLLELHF